jgi:beta-galactosidase
VPLVNGINTLESVATAGGKQWRDLKTIRFQLIPFTLSGSASPFSEMHVLLGANRYFNDEERQIVWIPAQPYRKGSWGWTGGKAFKQPNNNRLPYGTDKDILDTGSDPVYQTQQEGISSFRFDVGPGEYEVILHFAELTGATAKGIPYNLSAGKGTEQGIVNRSFNVLANGSTVLATFNIAAQHGISKAVSKKFTVSVMDTKGIQLDFQSISGEPVLNAIQLRKLN